MQPFSVVIIGDEVIDAISCVGDGLEGPRVELFVLQGLHEAFRFGVVEGIAGPRHADDDVMVSEALTVVIRRILDAAVRMMDETALRRPSGFERLIKRWLW
jgi:hypothetical protein